MTLSSSAYRTIVAPRLDDFEARYPDVRLDLSINESLVDIVRDGFHAGIRLGDRLTTDMVAVRLTGPLTPCYFAAPSYLADFGRPEHPRASDTSTSRPTALRTGRSSKAGSRRSSTRP